LDMRREQGLGLGSAVFVAKRHAAELLVQRHPQDKVRRVRGGCHENKSALATRLARSPSRSVHSAS
jgi:hypothetical protein